MKKLLTLFAASALASCFTHNQINAQNTWNLGTTVLTESDLVTGITLPWEILWGPDDYIWCTQRSGEVIRIDPATGNYTQILDLSSVIPDGGGSEPGMLGMVLHPDFANTPKVFIVYNYLSGNSVKERLSSFDWDGSALVNEEYLINGINGGWIHDGSRLAISPDNKIMMTTGDIGTGSNSQNMNSLNGKMLRINLDGSIPADNPDPGSYVYSFGHRNGQGLCYGPTGILYESEHGQNNADELNIILANRNYGWPTVQGLCNTSSEQTYCEENNVVEPLKEWSPCVAVNGISYYNHPAIPEWSNSIIMGVMGGLGGTSSSNDRVSVLHLSDDGLSITSEDEWFTTLNQRFRDVCINPYTGALYVALNGTSYPGTTPNKIKVFENLAFVSVNEPAAKMSQELKIYPNPAADNINLEVSTSLVGSTLQVFGYDGKLMKEVSIRSAKDTFNISDLNAGNYWIKATSTLGTVTGNFVKQ
jgi:glucose/arabinose dehydrogenase